MNRILQAIVFNLRYEAEDIVGIELRPLDDGAFPGFDAGAHIDLNLPNGMMRSYSLLNAPGETHRYVVAVLKDKTSRGGSRWVHEQLRIGMRLTISAPRNNFPLHEDSGHSVLVAGGIGVTPILCMGRRLQQLGKSFEVLYFARSRKSAAFVAEIESLGAPVTWHFDAEKGGPPDLKSLLVACGGKPNTHFYACGPSVMLNNFVTTCESLGYANAHIERFSAVEVVASAGAKKSYTVELKKSGKLITVTPEKSLLQTLIDAKVVVDYSCQEGICGACETRVLEGEPDHRDSVLSASEHASNKVMMICVSGCKSDRLVVDL